MVEQAISYLGIISTPRIIDELTPLASELDSSTAVVEFGLLVDCCTILSCLMYFTIDWAYQLLQWVTLLSSFTIPSMAPTRDAVALWGY